MDAVRFFAVREQFHLSSLEEESGRVIGQKALEGRRGEDPMTIVMTLLVSSAGATATDVQAHFEFFRHAGALTKNQEAELAACYSMLFDTIGRQEK
jgi:hypothetical protein